jgi:hypothetical protein
MKALIAVPFLLAALAAGCATMDESYAVPALHKQASFDLNCPADQLQIQEIGEDKYGVEGCHRRASYALQSCNATTHECTFTPASPPGY